MNNFLWGGMMWLGMQLHNITMIYRADSPWVMMGFGSDRQVVSQIGHVKIYIKN